MAYIKPAVQVYQELINAGGAAQINPDLPACVIGECVNIVSADLSDVVARTNSKAGELTAWTDQTVSVNANSAYTDQLIDDASVQVTLANVLIKTANYASVTADDVAKTLTFADGDNLVQGVSPTGNNNLDQVLPFDSNVNHASIGDTIVLNLDGPIVTTYITEITRVGSDVVVSLGDRTVDLSSIPTEVSVYSKFATFTPGMRDWNSTSQHLIVGPASSTHPEAGATGGATDYLFAVPAEVNGGAGTEVFIGYKAARADLQGQILTINDTTDLQDKLGEVTPDNPLALGVSMALANSGGAAVHAVALDPRADEILAHTAASELIEGQRVYAVVPLSQNLAVQAIYQKHVNAMSVPSSGNWRTVMVNQPIPTDIYTAGKPGTVDSDLDTDGWPDGLIFGTFDAVAEMITVDPQFGTEAISGIATGDELFYTTDENIEPSQIPATVLRKSGLNVYLAQGHSLVNGPVAFYTGRAASRQEQAEAIAAQSGTWMDKRVWNFPGNVYTTVDGFEQQVEGFYLMCALAGFISGAPAQQPITNITLAGVTSIAHGNFYFTEAQMNIMAGAGTLLYSQESQGTTPYCRHGLTTDVSVLEYREVLKVKNWDYLSYYYKDIVDPFIGTWNITPDTIQTIRQTVTAASETLLTRKLPRIGSPLLSYNIAKLAQSETNADAIDMEIGISIVNPNNYTNIYLQI